MRIPDFVIYCGNYNLFIEVDDSSNHELTSICECIRMNDICQKLVLNSIFIRIKLLNHKNCDVPMNERLMFLVERIYELYSIDNIDDFIQEYGEGKPYYVEYLYY